MAAVWVPCPAILANYHLLGDTAQIPNISSTWYSHNCLLRKDPKYLQLPHTLYIKLTCIKQPSVLCLHLHSTPEFTTGSSLSAIYFTNTLALHSAINFPQTTWICSQIYSFHQNVFNDNCVWYPARDIMGYIKINKINPQETALRKCLGS